MCECLETLSGTLKDFFTKDDLVVHHVEFEGLTKILGFLDNEPSLASHVRIYFDGDHRTLRKPIELNYCPFCGENQNKEIKTNGN